jgi:hypothetical protein
LVRDVVLSHPYGAPAKKAALPWASLKTHGRIDGRKLRRVRTQAELDALTRANAKSHADAEKRKAARREAEQRREEAEATRV